MHLHVIYLVQQLVHATAWVSADVIANWPPHSVLSRAADWSIVQRRGGRVVAVRRYCEQPLHPGRGMRIKRTKDEGARSPARW